MSTLPTFAQWNNHGGITGWDGYENYAGENPADMLVMPTSRNRDSDALQNSNFVTALKELGGESDTVQVHRFGHWACGWCELILIDPANAERVTTAENIVDRLNDYPILDESDFSKREQEDANETWKNCFDWRERVAYIRDHRGQFEPRDFSELMACVRGEYFIGYANELLA